MKWHKLPKEDRLLYFSGAPFDALHTKLAFDRLRFNNLSAKEQSRRASIPIAISPQEQHDFLAGLLRDPESLCQGSGIYVLGSEPDESPAQVVVAELARRYQDFTFRKAQMPKVSWIDLGFPDWDLLRGAANQSFVVLSGLTADPKRVSLARDFIRKFSGSLRLLTLCTSNSLDFSLNHLSIVPDAALQLELVGGKFL